MPSITKLDIIEQSRLDRLLAERSEEDCRTYAKTSLAFLSKAPGHVRRLNVLHQQAKLDRIARQAAALREASEKIGANRIAGICELLENEPSGSEIAALLSRLEDELALAERRIWQLAREMSLVISRKPR